MRTCSVEGVLISDRLAVLGDHVVDRLVDDELALIPAQPACVAGSRGS
jgi:hypothetical protein